MRIPVIILTFALLAIVSCDKTSTPLGVEYDIIKETPNTKLSKDNIDIRLSKKIDERDLGKIAAALRRDRKQYDRLWIAYYLPGMVAGKGAWATTHFTPDLEIRILGTTAEEEKKIVGEALGHSRAVEGIWLDDRPYIGATITLYRENSKLFLEMKFKDGSGSTNEMSEGASSNGTKLVEKGGNAHGEYYVLDSKGNLHAGDGSGIFLKYKKIK